MSGKPPRGGSPAMLQKIFEMFAGEEGPRYKVTGIMTSDPLGSNNLSGIKCKSFSISPNNTY